MKVVVTGGAGFIGSNFVHHLLEKHGWHITVLDALTYAGRKENLQDIWNRIEFIKGDIRKKEDIEKAVKGADLVVNFAAETHVDRSILEAGEFVLTNVFGTQQVLEACRKFDCRLMHISTDEVYGHIPEGSFSEEDRLNPRNPYAASKAAADLLCKAYHETYGLDVVITRSTNNYGPYQHPEKLIPKTIIYALLNKPIPVYGTGNNVRDWIFIRDNCEAMELIMLKGKASEIYNIAGKQELKNLDVVKTILKLLGKPENLITFVKDRPGHDLRYSLDIEKIKKLGWKPKTVFEEGIGQTIAWYKANEWWWKPILQGIDLHEKF